MCRKRRGEPAGLIFRGMPPNTPGEKRDAIAVLLVWDLDGIMTVKYKKDSRSSKNADKRRSFLS